MSDPFEKSLILATFLDQNIDEIAQAWAQLIDENTSFRTGGDWDAEVLASCRRGVISIADYICKGTMPSIDGYLIGLAKGCLEDGFESSEITANLLLVKEAVLPLMRAAYPEFDNHIWALICGLDASLNLLVSRFNQLYTREMNLRIKEQHELMSRLLRISKDGQNILKIDEALNQVANAIMAVVGMNSSLIFQVDEDVNELEFKRGISPVSVNVTISEALTEQVKNCLNWVFFPGLKQTRQPVACNNVQNDPRFRKASFTMDAVKSILAVPILVFDQLKAVIVVVSVQDWRSYTRLQMEMTWEIASTAALAIENDRLYTENSRSLAESQSIQRVTSALLQELKIEKVLEVVCSEAQTLTGALSSAVYFLENDDSLRLVFFTGEQPKLTKIPLRKSLSGRAVLESRTILSNNPAAEVTSRVSLAPLCLLTAPLNAKGRKVGALDLSNKPGGFTENDVHIINIYAAQAAIALENARLHQQVSYVAVLEERERLAREIHDNVAQTLGALKLQASFANDLLSDGQIELARANLVDLVKTTTEAHADLREAIFGLRNSPSMDTDLVTALQTYLEKYQKKYGLAISLSQNGETVHHYEPHTVVQVTRIVQEALTNVRKHARTAVVEVSLEEKGDRLFVTITDNGQGFNKSDVLGRDCGGVGLQVMRERAESVKGRLEIESSPGGGTRIRISVPIYGSK